MNPVRLHAALQLIFPPFFLLVTREKQEAAVCWRGPVFTRVNAYYLYMRNRAVLALGL